MTAVVVLKASGSLAWLWDRYRETGGWTILKASTRRARENIMAHVIAKGGHLPAGSFLPVDIIASRDARAETPSQAKGFLVCMRAMFRWAVIAGHVKADPTIGIKAFPKVKNGGFPVWTDNDVDRYHARWPLGTRQRVWIDVLLFSGLRRGDAVRFGRQHCRAIIIKNAQGMPEKVTIATLTTEKSQHTMTVTLPILPILQATLDAGPTGDMAFICGASGGPLVKESFGNMFREACDQAGVFGKSAHGVRKIGATTAADNGATEKELDSIFGWEGGNMSRVYTEAANRKRASLRAMAMLERTTDEQSMDAPDDVVRPAALIA